MQTNGVLKNRHTEGSNVTAENIATDKSTDTSYNIDRNGVLKNVLRISVFIGSGIVFGVAAEKGQVNIPSVVINQMLFSQFTMLKMFLSALASSICVFSAISLIPQTRNVFMKIRDSFSSSLTTQPQIQSLIGGAILGMGMSLSGSCPGMVLVQLGTGTHNAVVTFTGCMTGAMLYGLVHSYMPTTTSNKKEQFLDTHFNTSFASISIPLALLLGSIVLTIEYIIPWTTESPALESGVSMIAQKVWNPSFAGILIGLLQIPIIITIRDTIGGSSSYCTLLSQGLGKTGLLSSKYFNYFSRFRFGMGNWWQVLYVGGAVLGGAISSTLSGTWGTTSEVAPITAFIGGVCILFGAQMASGCTSGHGISGMGLLSTHSVIVVPMMFAAGTVTALITKYVM